jgi:hypothetical protein
VIGALDVVRNAQERIQVIGASWRSVIEMALECSHKVFTTLKTLGVRSLTDQRPRMAQSI